MLLINTLLVTINQHKTCEILVEQFSKFIVIYL